jgi:hypothetical protein
MRLLALLPVIILFLGSVIAMANGEYRFTVNGIAEKPQIISLDGDEANFRTGDVAWVATYCLVLDEPGEYQLQHLASDRDRLWRVDEQGKRTLIACRVSDFTGDEQKVSNPLESLSDEQLRQLRCVELETWPTGIDRQLAKLDPARCFIDLEYSGLSGTKGKPPLPDGIRYLSINEIARNEQPLAWLAKLDALEYFHFSGSREDFDAAWLPRGRTLRALHLFNIIHPEALSHLEGLKRLEISKWKGAGNTRVLKGLGSLRRLEFILSHIESLRDLPDLPAIEFVSAQGGPVRLLPQKPVPTLKRLDIQGAAVEDAEIASFRKVNPQCDLLYDQMEVLQRELTGIDSVRVRTGGACHRRPELEETLFETKDPETVQKVISMISVENNRGISMCMCCGEPSIEFYRGKELAVSLSMHHGRALRWDGWPGDAELTNISGESLTRWLAEHGAGKPAEELAKNRESERMMKRRQEMIMAILPREAFDALGKAQSEDEAADAFRKHITSDSKRAEIYLRSFGCDLGSWAHADSIDDLLKEKLLPKVPIKSLARVNLKPGEQAGNGLARWLIFEGKWREWPAAELARVFEIVAREGLTHPRDTNRRKTLLALGEMASPNARALLRAVLRRELKVRPLPEDSQAEVSGMVTFRPEPKWIPDDCPDQVHAAIWLARLKDEETKGEIAELVGTLSGENQKALKEALALKP